MSRAESTSRNSSQTAGGWIPLAFGLVRSFFKSLREVDVDRVGRAMFDHCTSPKALYVTLFERWWVVAACAFVGGCFGYYVCKTSTEQFETHGSLLIYQKMPTFLDNNMMVPDAKAYDSLFSTHVQLVGSELIVDRAIKQHELEEKCPGIVAKVEEKLGTEDEITFLGYVRNHLNIGRAGSGDSAGAFVVTVAFGHEVADECITVVDAILHTYRDYVNQSLLFDQDNAFELVKRTKEELEKEVNERNRNYREFIATAPSVWEEATEANPHQERVKELEKQRTELEFKRVALLSRIEIMAQTHDSTTGEPLTDIARLALIDEEHIPRLDVLAKIRDNELTAASQKAYPQLQEIESVKFDELLKKYAEKAEMLQQIGANHPRVIDHQATIDVLERKLKAFHESENDLEIQDAKLTAKQLVAAYVRMLNEEYADVTQKLLFLERKIKVEVKKAHELKSFTIRANQLKTEYERSQKHFEAVMDKTTKQHLLKEFGNFIAEIVGHPHKVEMTWPKKPVILGLCTILGIFAGSFLALSLDLIAYTPLRSVFWFMPLWLLGGAAAGAMAQRRERGLDSREGKEYDPAAAYVADEISGPFMQQSSANLTSASVPLEIRPNASLHVSADDEELRTRYSIQKRPLTIGKDQTQRTATKATNLSEAHKMSSSNRVEHPTAQQKPVVASEKVSDSIASSTMDSQDASSAVAYQVVQNKPRQQPSVPVENKPAHTSMTTTQNRQHQESSSGHAGRGIVEPVRNIPQQVNQTEDRSRPSAAAEGKVLLKRINPTQQTIRPNPSNTKKPTSGSPRRPGIKFPDGVKPVRNRPRRQESGDQDE